MQKSKWAFEFGPSMGERITAVQSLPCMPSRSIPRPTAASPQLCLRSTAAGASSSPRCTAAGALVWCASVDTGSALAVRDTALARPALAGLAGCAAGSAAGGGQPAGSVLAVARPQGRDVWRRWAQPLPNHPQRPPTPAFPTSRQQPQPPNPTWLGHLAVGVEGEDGRQRLAPPLVRQLRRRHLLRREQPAGTGGGCGVTAWGKAGASGGGGRAAGAAASAGQGAAIEQQTQRAWPAASPGAPGRRPSAGHRGPAPR